MAMSRVGDAHRPVVQAVCMKCNKKGNIYADDWRLGVRWCTNCLARADVAPCVVCGDSVPRKGDFAHVCYPCDRINRVSGRYPFKFEEAERKLAIV